MIHSIFTSVRISSLQNIRTTFIKIHTRIFHNYNAFRRKWLPLQLVNVKYFALRAHSTVVIIGLPEIIRYTTDRKSQIGAIYNWLLINQSIDQVSLFSQGKHEIKFLIFVRTALCFASRTGCITVNMQDVSYCPSLIWILGGGVGPKRKSSIETSQLSSSQNIYIVWNY